MHYLSLCSGIEAASVAWEPLGFRPLAFAEIEPFPSAVLEAHYPGVPNLGDITKFEEWPDFDRPVDLVCAGTPCQSFSVAGLRGGLDDERGNLMLVFAAIVRRYRPKWLVWENVPGVFSSDGGRDFASLLGLLAGRRVTVPSDGWRNAGIVEGYEGAYGLAWRVLDAQFTRVSGFPGAVPQRRRRVFLVGCASGDERRAAAVLFEPESLSGHPAPRRTAGQGASASLRASLGRRGGHPDGINEHDALIPAISNCLNARDYKQPRAEDNVGLVATLTHHPYADNVGQEDKLVVTHSLNASSAGNATEDGTGRGVPLVADPLTASMFRSNGATAGNNPGVVNAVIDMGGNRGMNGGGISEGFTPPLTPNSDGHAILSLAVRTRDGTPQLEANDDGAANAILTPNGGRAGIGVGAVAFDITGDGPGTKHGGREADTHTALRARPPGNSEGRTTTVVGQGMAVRRLTPIECARLQGFPDDYLDITYRGKPAADGPKYRALGNSWAVNCARWIGMRIAMVEALED
jgi:DNA (cytosine-5)-methyltransferase 1